MKNITLICVAGMSTSMMVGRMTEAAEKGNMDVKITAMSESSFSAYTGKTDVLLLGPQISYLYEKIKKQYEPKGIQVAVIEPRLYGMMDGEAVLKKALEMMEK